MTKMLRATASLIALALLGASPQSAIAQEQRNSIKIGYAISKSGPNAGGASITQIPNYQLWVKSVNDKGGIMLSSLGRRVPIELVEYDDRSSSEEAVRAVERLITQDKADLLLPPWGTALNLAVAPLFNKFDYPQLAFTAVTDRAADLGQRWPNSFWLLGTSEQYVRSLAALLTKLQKAGTIKPDVAMVSVADGFGIDLSTAARKAFKDAGLSLAYDKSYPVGTQDLSPLIAEAQRSGADTFVAFSYPPDTIALTDQARVAGYSPKIMFMGVGAAFPLFPQRFGADVEGILSLGGWSPNNEGTRNYNKAHIDAVGRGPDRWGSQVGYASLQMLEQAIERVGRIARPAIIKELQTGTFKTTLGDIKFNKNMFDAPWFWHIGQWQGENFVGVAPLRDGVSDVVVPKPAWKPR